MKCDTKTMIKIAAVGLGVAGVVYLAWPASHAFLVAAAPFLVFLVCPIAMILMMKSMNGNAKNESTNIGGNKVNSAAGEAKPDKP